MISSSEEEIEEQEETDSSDEEWEMDLKQWKEKIDEIKKVRSGCDQEFNKNKQKAGEVGSLKEIMVGYAGAVEEAPEWEELEPQCRQWRLCDCNR